MMSNKLFKLSAFFVLSAMLVAACGGLPGSAGAGGTATPLPPIVSEGEIVVDGRLVPNKWVDLAFNSSGEIAEVLVEEGD